MIKFNCSKCNQSFLVPDRLGGKNARCRVCGTSFRIPSGAQAAPQQTDGPKGAHQSERITISFEDGSAKSHAAKRKSPSTLSTESSLHSLSSAARKKLPVRIRRLMADAAHLEERFRNFPLIRIADRQGDPPDKYTVEYNVRGVARGPDGQPVYRQQHLVEIQLTSEYPRQSPRCKILTPIFHPNFDPTTVCVGDHWTSGERLADLIIRIGEMIAYQSYNVKSPLDGEAAMWADLNHAHFPVDRRDLRPPEDE